MATAYHDWRLETATPKIFLHASPGFFIPRERAAFYRAHLTSCRAERRRHRWRGAPSSQFGRHDWRSDALVSARC